MVRLLEITSVYLEAWRRFLFLFLWYIKTSARSMRSEEVSSRLLSRLTIPAEIPNGLRWSTENSLMKFLLKRSGWSNFLAWDLSTSLSHIANSSPPNRETKSPGRAIVVRKLASLIRALSPTLCPSESLISLKLSKSIKTRTPVGVLFAVFAKTLSVKYVSKVPLFRRPVRWSVVDNHSSLSRFAKCSSSIPISSADRSNRNRSSSFQFPLAPLPQETRSPVSYTPLTLPTILLV